jgi:hypothetical protein
LPKATVHVKKVTLARTLTLQILFQGKEYTSTITILYKRTLPQTVYFCWNPGNTIIIIPSYL